MHGRRQLAGHVFRGIRQAVCDLSPNHRLGELHGKALDLRPELLIVNATRLDSETSRFALLRNRCTMLRHACSFAQIRCPPGALREPLNDR